MRDLETQNTLGILFSYSHKRCCSASINCLSGSGIQSVEPYSTYLLSITFRLFVEVRGLAAKCELRREPAVDPLRNLQRGDRLERRRHSIASRRGSRQRRRRRLL